MNGVFPCPDGSVMRPPHCQPMFHRVLAAQELAVRQTLIDMRARFAGSDRDAASRAELVLAEVMNNIVQHGTGRGKKPASDAAGMAVTIHLTVARHKGGLCCAVLDDGRPLPPSCLLADAPAVDLVVPPCGGFGWPIVRALTRSLFYYREGPRNVLSFNVPLAEGSAVDTPCPNVA